MQQHAATFFAQAEGETGADQPQFVKDEFETYLECGILAHGFALTLYGHFIFVTSPGFQVSLSAGSVGP